MEPFLEIDTVDGSRHLNRRLYWKRPGRNNFQKNNGAYHYYHGRNYGADGNTQECDCSTNLLFVSSTGLVAGFTTMLGNLAGAFSNIYFLAMRMPKNGFIGTAAWVFLVINLFKLPFQVFYWKNITYASLQTDLVLLPALALGFWSGIKIVNRIKDDNYRKVVIVLTLIGSVVMFLKR